MKCTDGSRNIPNYHCRNDGTKCHLPQGGDCYKLDKPHPEHAEGSSLGEVCELRDLLMSRKDKIAFIDDQKDVTSLDNVVVDIENDALLIYLKPTQ